MNKIYGKRKLLDLMRAVQGNYNPQLPEKQS